MKTREPARSASAPTPAEHPFHLRRALERFERGFLHNILVLTQGDQRQAAELLDLSLADLQEKLSYYAMDNRS